MVITIRLNNEDASVIKEYANFHNMSVSEFLRKAALEKIEDEIDLQAYKESMAEYKANPVTYTLDEVEKELGLS